MAEAVAGARPTWKNKQRKKSASNVTADAELDGVDMNRTEEANGGVFDAYNVRASGKSGGRIKNINMRAPANGTDPNHPNTIISWDLKAEVAKAGSYKAVRRALKRSGIGQNLKASTRLGECARERANVRLFDELVRVSASTGVPSLNTPVTMQFSKRVKPPPPPRGDVAGEWAAGEQQRTAVLAELQADFARMKLVEEAFMKVTPPPTLPYYY